MHVEIQVALNFLISFLFNKLPRRRVNQFGEELEAALKTKFANHWYPNQPAKGSAYRCLKTANPLDPVFEIASRNCGLELCDVQEHLPAELSIWIDPGEVSYRMSEKSPVKLLCQKNELNGVAAKRVQSQFSQLNLSKSTTSEQNFLLNEPIEGFMTNQNDTIYNTNNVNEVSDLVSSGNGSPGNSSNHSSTSSSVDSGFNDNGTNNDLNVRKFRSFNPEAQCFKPIESSNLLSSFNNQNSNQFSTNNLPLMSGYNFSLQQQQQINQPQQQQNSFNSVPNQFSLSQSNNGFTNTTPNSTSYCFNNKNTLKQLNTSNSSSSTTAGFPKQNQTMTTAQFAQTKFGSTKLKTTTNNSNTGAICGINGTTKRNYTNRMSPTEFSNYIKQKAILQQQQQQQNANNGPQSSNNHQLSVPINSSNYGFGSLFNGLSPQQSRAISPISNQDNFLLMAAAAAAVSTNSNTNTPNKSNLLNSNCNTMRNSLNLATNSTSPIAATNLPSLNSAGNSVCSSLNSNSGSLKLILNNNTTTNNLSSPSSAPAGDKLLSDINYLNELFNNTSLSPVLGNPSSLSTPSTNNLKRFNINENFMDFNSNDFTNYANSEFNQQQNKKVNNIKKTSVENLGLINQNESKNLTNESIIQQNANKPTNGNEEKFDSFSLNNYSNQYQHLLVAN